MEYYPLFFKLTGQNVLIVGGGGVALRKARLFKKASAVISVVSPTVLPELAGLVRETGGKIFSQLYADELLENIELVIAATDDHAVHQKIVEDCRQRRILLNVVDSPQLCTVIVPALVDRSPIVVAVSSFGKAPILARRVRAHIESTVPAAYGKLATLMGNFRDRLARKIPPEQRLRFWESVLDGPIAERVLKGDTETAETLLAAKVDKAETQTTGEVYLVGAGPGDPDLLTFKALRLMQRADVVLYDRLVSEPILELVRRDADRIYVGKRRADHSVPQQNINLMLLELAQQGKRVLRLKGGDPFIFGRGGEEIGLLAEKNIPFQVVPGITAASGCAAYAGIPLTHRDYSQSVRFITGHLKEDAPNLKWAEFVADQQTLVFYMSLNGLQHICAHLIEHGKAPSTPAALVEKGTLADQRVHVGTIESLPAIVQAEQVHAPTLLIIGEVVHLHKQLKG